MVMKVAYTCEPVSELKLLIETRRTASLQFDVTAKFLSKYHPLNL